VPGSKQGQTHVGQIDRLRLSKGQGALGLSSRGVQLWTQVGQHAATQVCGWGGGGWVGQEGGGEEGGEGGGSVSIASGKACKQY
jgi:hypothetical protein